VEQDPADEPASELLKRIEAEKERLVKEGKIRKQQPIPLLGHEEIPFEVPEHWEWLRSGTSDSLRQNYPVVKQPGILWRYIPFVKPADLTGTASTTLATEFPRRC